MKRVLVCLLGVAACHPSIDFDLDLDPGPIDGEKGFATFSFVDGCPGADPLFGCRKQLPGFAMGSRARFVVGSISGDPADDQRLERAKASTLDPNVAIAGRDADGFLVLASVAPGDTTIRLMEDGDELETLSVHVEKITSMETYEWPPPDVITGARFGAAVEAYGTFRTPLYARGAITATTTNGLVLDNDNSGYFTASEQVAVRAEKPGDVDVIFRAGDVSTESTFHIVAREDITDIAISELYPDAGATKVRMFADIKAGDTAVRGGPACEWSIVSGGGPGAAISSSVDDDLDNAWFTLYNAAIVYGEGDMTVECRANDRVVGQHTLHLGQ